MLSLLLGLVGSVAAECFPSRYVLNEGEICGLGQFECNSFTFCSSEGQCKKKLEAGDTCLDRTGNGAYECSDGLTCKGPAGALVCVADAAPGAACTNDDDTLIPSCGAGLSCSANVCFGGSVNDTCISESNCAGSLTCEGSPLVCTAVGTGGDCTSNSDCLKDDTCSEFKCTPKVATAAGECVTLPCADGFACLDADHNALTNDVCVALSSLTPGAWCDNNPNVCQPPHRQVDGYCAGPNMPSFCNVDSDCSGDADYAFCSCEGARLTNGDGFCQITKCSHQRTVFDTCMANYCDARTFRDYTGSCGTSNCAQERADFLLCNSATSLQASMFLSLLSLFLFFINK